MSLTSSISVNVGADVATTVGLGTVTVPVGGSYSSGRIASGTGSGQADKIYAATLTIAASGTNSLDLAGGVTDPVSGATFSFVKVKAIYVKAASGNTNDVVIGGDGSSAFTGPFADATDKVSLKPGNVFLVTNTAGGWSVTASTGDILAIANSSSGTSVSCDVWIVGTSA